jgi:hypothetical protein
MSVIISFIHHQMAIFENYFIDPFLSVDILACENGCDKASTCLCWLIRLEFTTHSTCGCEMLLLALDDSLVAPF